MEAWMVIILIIGGIIAIAFNIWNHKSSRKPKYNTIEPKNKSLYYPRRIKSNISEEEWDRKLDANKEKKK